MVRESSESVRARNEALWARRGDFDTLAIAAGPGGFDEANRLLGSPLRILGVDNSADACATATAAGHARLQMDLRDLDPAELEGFTGVIATPPCPTFSAAGLRTGLRDYQHMLDAITCLGTDHCGHECDEDCLDFGCEHTHPHDEHLQCEAWRAVEEEVSDARTSLVAHALRLVLKGPSLEWFVLEQVPALEYAWEDLAAELYAAGWESITVLTLDAVDFGAPSRRRRVFAFGSKYAGMGSLCMPAAPRLTSAREILGWQAGERVRTRGDRRATGGNFFSADGPSWCLTGKSRSWERERDGLRWTPAEAGALQGFPRDYPWVGSRTSAFQQIGDVVSPLVGAAVLNAVSPCPLPRAEMTRRLEEHVKSLAPSPPRAVAV